MKFYRKGSSIGYDVNTKQDIIECMGELANSIQSIEILNNGLVIGYIGDQGVTLGHLENDNL